jgi:hypothetical protein
MELVHGAVLLGLAAVAPLALGRWRLWLLAAGSAAVAYGLPLGLPAGAVAVVPLAVSLVVAWSERPATGAPLVRGLAAAWAVVATGSLVTSRLGLEPFGIREPIVELAAVHYLFAGTGAITLAGATGDRWTIGFTAGAPPVVALGFLTGWAVPQVGGAVLMAAGVLAVAAFQLRRAVAGGSRAWRRIGLAVSGLAIWAPMALAIAWAAGQHWDVPALSVPDMVRWHGAPNAVLFVVVGLLATRSGEGAARCAA